MNTIITITSLRFREGNSDKEYHVAVEPDAVILVGCDPFSETVSDFDAYTWFIGVSRARQLLAVVNLG